jgi:photosystem II reaction center protein PsbP
MTVKPMFLCLLSIEISILTLILLSTSQTFVLASTEINNTVTYENREYGFAFDYPSTWHNEYDANEAQLNNVVIALADPFSNDTQGFEQTSFHVNASDVRKSPGNDLQIKSNTAEDYIRNRINQENESLFQTNAGIKEATDFEESDKPLFTLEYHKNSTTSVGGENASKVQYITSFEGEQKQFSMFIYVVKDEKVYELSFFSEPLQVPETLPIGENTIKSFRFL